MVDPHWRALRPSPRYRKFTEHDVVPLVKSAAAGRLTRRNKMRHSL